MKLFDEPLYQESGTLFFHDFVDIFPDEERQAISDFLWSFMEEYVAWTRRLFARV